MKDFMTLAETRCSVRDFAPRAVEKEKLTKILEAGRLAPTAKNLQPQRIYVLESEEALRKIRAITPCAFNAPVVLLVCASESETWHRDGTFSSAMMDASIVCSHMMFEAEDLGLGTTWVLRFDPDRVSEAFDLPADHLPACLLPLGYAAEGYEPSPRHTDRKPLTDTVYYL